MWASQSVDFRGHANFLPTPSHGRNFIPRLSFVLFPLKKSKEKTHFTRQFSPQNSKPQWRISQFDPIITPFSLTPLVKTPTLQFSTQFLPLAWFLTPISFDYACEFAVASRRKKMSKAMKRFPLFFLAYESMHPSELGLFRNLKTIRALEMGLAKWGFIRIGRRGGMFLIDINWLALRRLPSLFVTWIRFGPLFFVTFEFYWIKCWWVSIFAMGVSVFRCFLWDLLGFVVVIVDRWI